MAKLVSDYNPIHLDEEYANTTKFKKVIAHGVFSVGLISGAIGTLLPNSIYIYQDIKYKYA